MVICEKFDDNYENVTTNRDEFMKELRERCGDTSRYEMKPDEVEFYAAQSDGQKISLHWLDGDKVKSSEEKVPDGMEKLWDSAETNSIGLAARFPDGNGDCILAPLSQLCKLSLGNRAKFTFNGDWSTPINKIALAKLYEEMIRREAKKETVQLISVYGKVQAIMSGVYSPIGHDEFFEKVDTKLTERYGSTVALRRGYISQKWSRGTWYIGEFTSDVFKQKVELGLSAMDSQTGHSGAILQPVLFSGRKKRAMLFDDSWYAKHMSLTEEGIEEAIDTTYMTLNDNAQKLLDTIGIKLKNPGRYARKVCEELNKLAKSTNGVLLPQKTINSFLTAVDGLSVIRSNIAVWDIIEMLWDIPGTTGTCENHTDGLMKTVSRVLGLNHQALDMAS